MADRLTAEEEAELRPGGTPTQERIWATLDAARAERDNWKRVYEQECETTSELSDDLKHAGEYFCKAAKRRRALYLLAAKYRKARAELAEARAWIAEQPCEGTRTGPCLHYPDAACPKDGCCLDRKEPSEKRDRPGYVGIKDCGECPPCVERARER